MQSVFKTKIHQAYDRRAKSDQVVTYIANKFLKKTDGAEAIGDFDMDKSAEEEAMLKLKEQRRK